MDALPLDVNRIRRPDNFLYRGAKFLKTHKHKIILGALGGIILSGALIGGLVGGLKKKKEGRLVRSVKLLNDAAEEEEKERKSNKSKVINKRSKKRKSSSKRK